MTNEVKRCEICNLTHQYLYGTPTGYVHAECLNPERARLASRLIDEMLWEEEIELPRKFE